MGPREHRYDSSGSRLPCEREALLSVRQFEGWTGDAFADSHG